MWLLINQALSVVLRIAAVLWILGLGRRTKSWLLCLGAVPLAVWAGLQLQQMLGFNIDNGGAALLITTVVATLPLLSWFREMAWWPKLATAILTAVLALLAGQYVSNQIWGVPAEYPGEGQNVLTMSALLLIIITFIEHWGRQQERANARVRESEQKHRVLAGTVLDLITALDTEGTFVYVTSSSKTVLGYEPEELIDRESPPDL